MPATTPRTVVVVTGGTGFVAGHVIQRFLEGGHDVRVTVRDPTSARCAYLADMAAAPAVTAAGGTLSLFKADLTVAGSFDAAFRGAALVIHTAAVVKNEFGKDPYEIITPGLLGAVEVATAAARAGTVRRIVFTSSVAAILQPEAERAPTRRGRPFDESEWRLDCRPHHAPYEAEKVLSERAMYDNFPGEVVSINPACVLGPQLNGHTDSSLAVMKMLGNREYPFAPALRLGFVDVRDVASAHYAAAFTTKLPPGLRHRRYICTLPSIRPLSDVAKIVNAEFAHLNAPETQMPWWLLYLASWFDKRVTNMVLYEYGAERPDFDTSRITSGELEGFKFQFTEMDQIVRDCVASMIKFGVVPQAPSGASPRQQKDKAS